MNEMMKSTSIVKIKKILNYIKKLNLLCEQMKIRIKEVG